MAIWYQSKIMLYQILKQLMIETSEADIFFDKIYELATDKISKTKGMDVIVILGGTGSGKSTLISMIAGCQITAIPYQDQFRLESNSSIAKIGHEESQTFQPNFWQGNGLKIYDCPGFNDTRSIQFEISKSFFIKEIVDNANSYKIILVGDIHSIKGSRCGPILTCFSQLKEFIPNFDPSNDYSLVITKAQRKTSPEHIAKYFKTLAKIDISPAKANIIYEAEDEGIYDYSYINFKAIFDGAPSMSTKCNLPLSAEAKLKLIEISKELNVSVVKAVKAFLIAVRIYYFQVLTSMIQADNASFKMVFQTFQKIENIKDSTDPEVFIKSLEKYCLKLHHLCQFGFNYSPYFDFISKKIDQMQFLKKKIDSFQISVQSWVECVQFNGQMFKKSTNSETMRNLDSFSSFLRSNAIIDINKSIEAQAHQNLITQQAIHAKYSGSKQITVQLERNDRCEKTLIKPFVIKELFQKQVPYSGLLKYFDFRIARGTVPVQSCSCGNWLVDRCLNCKHYYKDLQFSQTVQCSGQLYYSGKIMHRQWQIVEQTARIQLRQDFNVKQSCIQTVKYEGYHDAICSSHHRCSCESLANIFFSAKNLLQDIMCYHQIKVAQEKQIAILKNGQNSKTVKDCYLPIEDFSMQSYKINNPQLTYKQITAKIHERLTQRCYFFYPYSGSKQILVKKPYCKDINFKGTQTLKTPVRHTANVPFRGYVPYQRQIPYNGSILAHTCYFECRWCNDSTYEQQYSGTEKFKGQVEYSGSVPIFEGKWVTKQIAYEENVSRAGILQRKIQVPYKGDNQVCCQTSSSLGQGHHDCSSCKTWDRFVNAFKRLIEVKEIAVKEIESNMETLNSLINPEKKQQVGKA